MRYEISWTRDEGRFRAVTEEGDMRLFRAANGLMWVYKTDNKEGRLWVETDLMVDRDGNATLKYAGTIKAAKDNVPKEAVEVGHGGKHRLCFNRDDEVEGPFEYCWRCCDELGDNEMRYFDSYSGLWYVDWNDKRAHLYHLGKVFLDPTTNIGYLVPESLPKEFIGKRSKVTA